MNKGPIFWLLVAIAIVAAVAGMLFVRDAVEGRRYFITIATASAGRELIEVTNASHWIRVGPELLGDLSGLLASPTHINKVVLGDDRPPVGDGHASSRLVLTNELGRGLAMRLRLRHDAGQGPIFDVLSYSRITEPSGLSQ